MTGSVNSTICRALPCADKQRQDIEDALLGSEEESQALDRKKQEKKERLKERQSASKAAADAEAAARLKVSIIHGC